MQTTIMQSQASQSSKRLLRVLNDKFRITFNRRYGFVNLHHRIKSMDPTERAEVLLRVMSFRDFDEELDSDFEHRKGTFQYKKYVIGFVIDYCDLSMCYTSKDPCNIEKTIRVLTIRKVREFF